MRKVLSGLLMLLTSVCFSQQTLNLTMNHDGLEREYILYVPAIYDGQTSVPLLMNFHGYTSNAQEQMTYGDFKSIADTAGFIIVHPQGTLDDQNQTYWNAGWGGNVDDVGFVSALIDTISSNYSVDLSRVYSTGFSNGSFMSFALACELSDKVAAIAGVAGSMNAYMDVTCNSTHPMPVMMINGTSDSTVPYDGITNQMESVDNVISYWVNENNCNATPTTTEVPNTNTVDGSSVTHYVYTGGDNGVEVELMKVNNGGHTWPGAAFPLLGTNYDIDASIEIWRFLSQFDMNGKITSVQSKVKEQEFIVFPNVSEGQVNIKIEESGDYQYDILNTNGQVVLSNSFSGNQHQFSVESLSNGIYYLRIYSAQNEIVLTQKLVKKN